LVVVHEREQALHLLLAVQVVVGGG
jgi:hypothetical protein